MCPDVRFLFFLFPSCRHISSFMHNVPFPSPQRPRILVQVRPNEPTVQMFRLLKVHSAVMLFHTDTTNLTQVCVSWSRKCLSSRSLHLH